MMTISIDEQSVEAQILGELRRMDSSQKQQVLDYAELLTHRKSSKPEGISGTELLALVASLDFDPQDLAEMRAVIEEYEEVIEPDDIPSADDW